ncbi:MAG: hypothetical protein ACTHNU_05350 [Gaiellales bacterium]
MVTQFYYRPNPESSSFRVISARWVALRPAYIVIVTPGFAWRASSAASTGVSPFASASATRL